MSILLFYLLSLFRPLIFFLFFFFNDTATTEIYTLSLHDALPILPRAGPPWRDRCGRSRDRVGGPVPAVAVGGADGVLRCGLRSWRAGRSSRRRPRGGARSSADGRAVNPHGCGACVLVVGDLPERAEWGALAGRTGRATSHRVRVRLCHSRRRSGPAAPCVWGRWSRRMPAGGRVARGLALGDDSAHLL